MENPTQKQFQGWLVILGVLSAVGPLSIDMYLPSFSAAEKALAAPPGGMALTLASFFIGLTLGQLVYGPVSDRFGRKPPLYFGFALFTLASLGCALARDVTQLQIFRFLQGLGGCAGISLPMAMVRDRLAARDSARAFSRLMLVMGLAPILAPLAGGWILILFGWRAVFVVLALFGAGALLSIAFGLTESRDTTHAEPLRFGSVVKNYGYLLSNRAYLGFVLAGALSMAGMFAYIAGSPFVLIDLYGVKVEHYGWFFGANAFGLIFCSQLNSRLLAFYPSATILRAALFAPPLVGLALAGLALTGQISLPLFLAGFFIFIASVGLILPNASALSLATQGQMAGVAAALGSALQSLFATLAGALVGVFHNGTGQPLAVIMALCGCGAWLSHRLLVPHKKPQG